MARRLDPAAAAQKWEQRMATAGNDYIKGVERVTENPMAKAAAREDFWASQVQQAAAAHRFSGKLNRMQLQDWKGPAIKKGAPRLASGAAEAKPKVTSFQQKLAQQMEPILAEIDNMPKDTLDQRLAKANAYARAMHQTKGQY